MNEFATVDVSHGNPSPVERRDYDEIYTDDLGV